MPVMNPRRRTSATAGSGATGSASGSPSSAIFGCAARSSVRSCSNTSSVASAAAHASGLPVYVWPWKNVLSSRVLAEEAVVDALGGERRRERQVAAVMPLATHIRSGATPSCSQANIGPVRPNPVATSSQISSTP